jgi:hypothetical protein
MPVTYDQLRLALIANEKSYMQEIGLPTNGPTDLEKVLPPTDPNPKGGMDFDITVGEARLLGLSPQSLGVDGQILLSSNINWTWGQDAIGTLEHEITEQAMGRISQLGVTNPDGNWTPLDLFRYSASQFEAQGLLYPRAAARLQGGWESGLFLIRRYQSAHAIPQPGRGQQL